MHPTEVRVLDVNAAHHGVPQIHLMENAGRGVAEAVCKHFDISRCLIVCGAGNNGGDGLVAARYLSSTKEVNVILVKPLSSSLTRTNLRRLKKLAVPTQCYDEKVFSTQVADSDLVIDAMLGIGISGPLRPPFDTLVGTINREAQSVLAVDIPTGLGNELCLQPDVTVTFHDVKDGMNAANSGIIEIKDIGIPADAVEQVGPGDMTLYPRPELTSHKGQNGVVLTIGGGPFFGAPALAALGALRTGADLSLVASPEPAQRVIASFSPDLITIPLSGTILHPAQLETISPYFEKADAVVLGPGLGTAKNTHAAVEELIDAVCALDIPLVVDADAIGAFGDRSGGGITVITPHAGEFTDLTGTPLPKDAEDRKIAVRKAAAERNCTILLKGSKDIISDGKTVKVNCTHNEGMTVGGTGDVLSGITGALLSKGASALDAARMAAFINGSAGNILFADRSYGITATDLLDAIPWVIAAYL